jgi:hypothetical protein
MVAVAPPAAVGTYLTPRNCVPPPAAMLAPVRLSPTTANWLALVPVKVYVMLSIAIDPLFFTVREIVVLDVPTPTLAKIADEGEMVSGPTPMPFMVAESV